MNEKHYGPKTTALSALLLVFCNLIFDLFVLICCLVCKTFKALGFCCNLEEDIVVLFRFKKMPLSSV